MPLAPSGLSGVGVSVERTVNEGSSAADGMPYSARLRGHRVAVLVVADLFVERLAHARRDASVLLARDEQRVEHRAAVVDGDMIDEADLPGVAVDFDHRDVGAEREGRVGLLEHELAAQAARRRPRRRGRQLGPRKRRGRHAGHADRAG